MSASDFKTCSLFANNKVDDVSKLLFAFGSWVCILAGRSERVVAYTEWMVQLKYQVFTCECVQVGLPYWHSHGNEIFWCRSLFMSNDSSSKKTKSKQNQKHWTKLCIKFEMNAIIKELIRRMYYLTKTVIWSRLTASHSNLCGTICPEIVFGDKLRDRYDLVYFKSPFIWVWHALFHNTCCHLVNKCYIPLKLRWKS